MAEEHEIVLPSSGKKIIARVEPGPKGCAGDELLLNILGRLEGDEVIPEEPHKEPTFLIIEPTDASLDFNGGLLGFWEKYRKGDIDLRGHRINIRRAGHYLIRVQLNFMTFCAGIGSRVSLMGDDGSEENFPVTIEDTDIAKVVYLEEGEYELFHENENGVSYTGSYLDLCESSISIILIDTIFPQLDPDVAKALFSSHARHLSFDDNTFMEIDGLVSLNEDAFKRKLTDLATQGNGSLIANPCSGALEVSHWWLKEVFDEMAKNMGSGIDAEECVKIVHEEIVKGVNHWIAEHGRAIEKLRTGSVDRLDFKEFKEHQAKVSKDTDRDLHHLWKALEAHRVRVDERDEKTVSVLDALSQRIAALEDEAAKVIEVEPESLSDTLRRVKATTEVRKTTDQEKQLDKLAWPIFDQHKDLHKLGGHYVLDNLFDDMVTLHDIEREEIAGLDIEDLIATAVRYAMKRSRWYMNRKYWVQPCADFVILRRDRLRCQAIEPKGNEGDFLKGYA